MLLERDPMLGSRASAASAGGLRQQFSEEPDVLFAMEGVRQIRRLLAETGFDPEFRVNGYLLLAASGARLAALETQAAMQRRLGLPVEVLSPAEVGRRFGVLHTGDLHGAAFCASDGYCDPHAVVQAFAATARAAGIAIRTGVEVTGLLRQGVSVTGVRTTAGEIRAEYTVDAAGAWGGRIASMAGLSLPLRPRRRQIFNTHPFDFRFPADLPLVIENERPFYFRPESGGAILSLAEVDEVPDLEPVLDRSRLDVLVERAVHRCPALEQASIAGGWAGLRTLTPDDRAILGDAPGAPGLVLAVGLGGHGVTHGPAVGLAIAERIVHGAARTLSLAPYAPARFAC